MLIASGTMVSPTPERWSATPPLPPQCATSRALELVIDVGDGSEIFMSPPKIDRAVFAPAGYYYGMAKNKAAKTAPPNGSVLPIIQQKLDPKLDELFKTSVSAPPARKLELID
jgi:hypothetical protein